MAHQDLNRATVRQQIFDNAKEICYLENNSLNEDQRHRLWMSQAPELASWLGMPMPRSGDVEFSKRAGSSPMMKSKSEQLPSRRRSSKMFREQSASTNVRILPAKPINTNHSHMLQVTQSTPSHRPLSISPPKCRRTNSGHRMSMPVLSENDIPEFSPQEYLEHDSFRISPLSSQELSTQCYPETTPQIHYTPSWPSQELSALSPPLLDSGESSPSFSTTMSRQCSSLSSGLDMLRIQSEGAGSCLSQDSNQYSTSLPNMITHNYQAYPTIPFDLQQIVPPVDITMTRMWSNAEPATPVNGCELSGSLQYKDDTTKKRPLTLESSTAYDNKAASLTNAPVAIRTVGGRDKCAIPRTIVPPRPRQKLQCTQCSKHPEGFRGDHELRRHIDRAHAKKSRKVWICIDASVGQTFLANCKACARQKTYGAYYNAAAHLRRVHFSPKEPGPKTKGIATRAGKGGGDWPAMDLLKSDWIKEIDEQVNPTSSSNTEDEGEESNDDPVGPPDMSTSTSGFILDERSFVNNGMPLYQPCPPQQPFAYASNFSFGPSDNCNIPCAVGHDRLVFS